MKARDSQTGTFKDVYVKALDSMPVGTQIEYTGDTIPTGWEEVNDYSTTEIDTGKKWINGKPIYRKVFDFNTAILVGSSWVDIVDISSLNKEAITDIKTLNGSNIAWTGTISRITSNKLQLFNIGISGTDWYVKTLVLEYTKTTD